MGRGRGKACLLFPTEQQVLLIIELSKAHSPTAHQAELCKRRQVLASALLLSCAAIAPVTAVPITNLHSQHTNHVCPVQGEKMLHVLAI